MSTNAKKCTLSLLMGLNCAALCLPWVNYSGVKVVTGSVVLSRHLVASLVVLGLYFLSVWLYQLWKPGCFILGLACLCVLLGMMAQQISIFGPIALESPGPYLGVGAVVLNVVVYVVLLRRTFSPQTE
ncbi:hypothetical protein H9X86_08830 [Pseudoflavonifractor capillosus]|uniref:hypothetical protein n=1 Tax=Pseudoflavonifractor capillosus TaxID=106588 RepID=UPI00195BF982|nr:hypothetical protein [Pseudoflavonifractor capillosus]MBM6897464.1 hypothetical protein [Pseudoflavonifractor capillosus]